MVNGAFKRFDHDHIFIERSDGTKMVDVFDYTSPLSFMGRIADFVFLERYMKNALIVRNKLIKEVAESGAYSKYIGKSR